MENLLDLQRDLMYQCRSELCALVNRVLPQGDENSDEAKSIRSDMDLYCHMVGSLYTSIIHEKIVNKVIAYCEKYNITI